MSFKISRLTGKLYNDELVEIPFNTNNEMYLEFENWINKGNEVISFDGTLEEIAEHNKPLVPQEISKMALSLRLLERNISGQDIFDDIDSIPDSMFPPLEKAKAKVKYITARTFERHDADLNLVATMEGLSQDDVDQIFIGN